VRTGPPEPARRPALGALLVLAAASLWATFGIFAKRLYEAGLAPLELASTRAAVGFAAVALFVAVRAGARAAMRRESAPPAVSASPKAGGTSLLAVARAPRSLLFFAAYGVLGYALFTLVFFRALEVTTVSVAVALLYTAPAFVLAMSAVLWQERVDAARIAALCLVLGGVLLVTGAAGSLLRGSATLPAAALGLGLAAGATYAVYTMFSKVSTERYGPTSSLFWSFGFATLAFALLSPPHAPFVTAPEQTVALLGLGIVPTLMPYALYLAALRELRASTAAMLASIEPVVAAVLAALLLHERMDLLQGLGVLLVVSAAALLAREVSSPAG
jgi:drug/metabolite transporter, DME family